MIRPALAVLLLSAAVQAPPPPNFTITLDGGPFTRATFVLKPFGATYANNVWRSKRDPRVDRFNFVSDRSGPIPAVLFGADARIGTTSFDRADEDNPNRNPYIRFDLYTEDWPAAAGFRFDLVHVDVTLTRFDDVGGRVEGTIRGTYELCTLPGNGGGNCTARAPLTLTGRFSIVRGKDRVID